MESSNRTDPFSAATRPVVTSSPFWRLMPAGMRKRWWLFRPFDLIARYLPIFKKKKGLLAVRMDGIGDMVLFRSSLDHYAEAFGVDKADITVLGCDSWQPITDRVFGGYRVITIDEHKFARHLLYRFFVALRIRCLAPKIAVCDSYLRRAMMADSLVWLSGAERTVVSMPYVNEPTRAEFTYYLSQVDEIIDTGPYPTHEIVRHFRFVSAIAGKIYAPKPTQIDWECPTSGLVTAAPYAVINPGSNEPGRRWPFSAYVAIAEKLLLLGWQVVFVGTREERWDLSMLQAIARRDGVIDLTGQTSLPLLLDMIGHARLMVSNDTGPAHLSIALGTPTVVNVGGGHFTSFVPYPAEITPDHAEFVYEQMDCYHCFWRCHKRHSKFDVFPCVEAISIDTVWDACARLIDVSADKDSTVAQPEATEPSRPAASL